MSLQPNFEVLWIEQVLKNQVKPMLPSTLSTSLPSKDTKKASETAYSQIRCQRCFIFSLLNSPQPLISRGFPSFPTSSRMVSRQNVLFVRYSVKLHHTNNHTDKRCLPSYHRSICFFSGCVRPGWSRSASDSFHLLYKSFYQKGFLFL